MYKSRFYIFLILLLSGQAVLGLDSLKKARMPQYRYYVYAGSFFSSNTTTLRVDANAIGSYLNLESERLLDKAVTNFRMEAKGQFSPRSHVSATFFSIHRSSLSTVNSTFKIADTTIEKGGTLNTKFNISYFGATYSYALFYDKNWSLGLSTGLRVLTLGLGLNATSMNKPDFNYEGSYWVPTLLFGVQGHAYIKPKLLGRYSFEVFGLEVQGIKGFVSDQRVSLEYYIFKNMGLGLNYTLINYRVSEYPVNNFINGEVSYVVTGASILLNVRF